VDTFEATEAPAVPVDASPPEPRIYKVPEHNVPSLQARLARLAKRAAKLGVEAPVVEQCGVEDRKRRVEHDGVERIVIERYVCFQLVSSAPVRFSGWTLAAVVDYLYGANNERVNLLKTVPSYNKPLPQSYRTDDATCDHCGTARRRSQTFVVAHTEGSTKRIGRQCLADFLGHNGADHILATSGFFEEIGAALDESECGGGYGAVWRFGISEVLAYAATSIRTVGWTSRSKAREFGTEATADNVWGWLTYYVRKPNKNEKRPPTPESGDVATATAALEWARALPADVDSDYLYNVRAVATVGSVTGKENGIACSIVSAYLREQDKLTYAKRATAKPSAFIGKVGDHIGRKSKTSLPAVEVEVMGVHTFEGTFGITTILRMQTDEGNDLVTFYSGALDDEIKRGVRLRVIATVKKQEADKKTSRPTTYLSRCKFEILKTGNAT
jgi:hypothetical protein